MLDSAQTAFVVAIELDVEVDHESHTPYVSDARGRSFRGRRCSTSKPS